VLNVKVPVFMGAGAVSVKVLNAVVFSPSRARFLPEAEIQVVPPENLTVAVPVPVWVAVGPTEYWV
jgi:hypothetical protein